MPVKDPQHTGGAAESCCAIGVDVGGTKIAGGVVEFPAGEMLAKRVIETRVSRPGQDILADALGLVEELSQQARRLGFEARGIGVGVAELVNPEGSVTSDYRIAWKGLPVLTAFSRLAPAVLDADVRAAALAEATFGAGREYDPFVYVTVGTGISHSLVLDGLPYRGAGGNAELFASSPWTTTCLQCGSVLQPVLEDLASGPALVAHYNQAQRGHANRAEDVIQAAEAGDSVAQQVVRRAAEALGTGVGFLVNVLDPEAVIVGGGLGLSGGRYWSTFVESTRAHIWSDTACNLPILPASLGTDAGLVGAATMVWLRERPRYVAETRKQSRRQPRDSIRPRH